MGFKFNPGCNCCGETGDCASCQDGIVPTEMIITLAGFANGPICICTTLNADFHLSYFGPVASGCTDLFASPDSCCQFSYVSTFNCTIFGTVGWGVSLYLIQDGGHYYIEVDVGQVGFPINIARFLLDLGTSAPDCTTFSALDIPLDATNGSAIQCNESAATCVVTSA